MTTSEPKCPFFDVKCESRVLDGSRDLYYFDDDENFDYFISHKAFSKVKEGFKSTSVIT